MKRLRVYFNFANYDSITVNWSVKQSDKVIDNGVKIINLPYIDLPFYENAEYNLSYFATNSYGKSPKYEFQTTTTTKTDYITFINVEVAPTQDSAHITWNKVPNASQCTVYIFHEGVTSRVTVYNNEYNFKPSQDGNYSFAVEVNGVLSEKTPQYYLYKKPIIGTNQKPNPPSMSANATYDKKTYKATVTITVTHSNSSDVAGTYLTVQPDGQGKEIFYLPASAPSTSETVTKEYIVTADTNIIVTAYSITVDGVISDTVSYSVPISIGSTLPSVPANLTLTTTYDTNLQAPVVDISFDAVTWEVPFSYEVAYSFNGLNWTYLRTNEISVRIIAPYGGITAYAKVRVIDTHDNVSSWSAVKSITVAGDSVAPATPTGLTATGLFQSVMVKFTPNTEEDFDHYVLQYDTDSNFTNPTEIISSANFVVIKELTVNTTYYFRIKAVDKSGNESDWSTTVSASTVKIDNENYYDYAAIKDAIIHNGYIDSAWISELDAGLIKSGYIDADRIQAGSITSDKLVVQPANALPEGTIAYWTDSLIDVVNGIVPEGYTEVNLAPSITLTPYNAPEGSVVGDLLAGNKIYAGKSIQVGNKVFIENTSSDKGQIRVNSGGVDIVKIGESALDDSSDGIAIFNGKLQIKNSDNSKTLLDANGIRQIYNISLIDQLDSTRGLSIPIYIPQNADGTGVTNGTARIIVNVEKYRAYSKSALGGGSYSKTQTSQTAAAPWDMLQIETGYGVRTDVAQTILTNSSGGTRTTNTGGSHNHGGKTGSTGIGSPTTTGFINGGSAGSDHTHSVPQASNDVHTHDISRSGAHTHDVDISHTHTIDVLQINKHKHLVTLYLSDLQHTHDVTISIPAHSHNLQYGIYESTVTATVTIKKGTTTIGTVTTGNKGDFANIAVNDGDVISITANNLARVQVYIFVEYYLK